MSLVGVEDRGAVRHIVLKRPQKRNALNGELDACTRALADELLAGAPRALGLAKRVLDAAAKPALAETLKQEVQAGEALAATEDFAEGAAAFFEKRPPEFAGR